MGSGNSMSSIAVRFTCFPFPFTGFVFAFAGFAFVFAGFVIWIRRRIVRSDRRGKPFAGCVWSATRRGVVSSSLRLRSR